MSLVHSHPPHPAAGACDADSPLLDVRHLSVDVATARGPLRLVNDVSFTVERGQAVALVGESGSGKTMTACAVMNLFPTPQLSVAGGEVWLEGRNLAALSAAQLREVRGARVGMVFQDPSSFLDPLMPVGRQIAQTLRAHGRHEGVDARVLELIELMELPTPQQTARKFPHELSGGQRQRVLIAAALAMEPALLIADEPTTALDVTVQAGILKLLVRLREQLQLGVLLITHDLGVVAQTCQEVNVMYAGELVERGEVGALFRTPRHPYTQGLLRSVLGNTARREPLFSIPGGVPIAGQWPSGCRFHPRCPSAEPGRCDTLAPPLQATTADGVSRCHFSSASDAARSATAWVQTGASA
jgi:oligopeptide/dipeptide ABC transporter ATP-binding protein